MNILLNSVDITYLKSNIIYNFHFEVKLWKYVVLRRKGRLGVFYKRDVDITLRVSDCEELVGPQIEHLGRNAINYFLYDSWGQLAPPGGLYAEPTPPTLLLIGFYTTCNI